MIDKTAGEHSSHAMIALRPDDDVCKTFAGMKECTEPVEDLHLTLFYIGEVDPGDVAAEERYHRGIYDFVLHAGYRGLTGQANGFGVFLNEENSLVALWDIPGIAEFRTSLLGYVRNHVGTMRQENHGFTPHMTLANTSDPIRKIPRLPSGNPEKVVFGSVWLVWGDRWTQVTLL